MFSILPCMCSRSCQADATCDRSPRFQVCLDAQCPQTHRSAEACGSHLGAVVVALTTWAREQHLTNADLTVLTIAPPPRESHPRRQSRSSLVQTSGFVFSTIHLRDQGSMPAPRSRLSRSLTQSSLSTLRWPHALPRHGKGQATTAMTRPFPQSTDPLHRVVAPNATHPVHATGPNKRARTVPDKVPMHSASRFLRYLRQVPETRDTKRTKQSRTL